MTERALQFIRMGARDDIPEYWRYKICREMHWDYYQFLAAPIFFKQEILIFMIQEFQQNTPVESTDEHTRRMAELAPDQREVQIVRG